MIDSIGNYAFSNLTALESLPPPQHARLQTPTLRAQRHSFQHNRLDHRHELLRPHVVGISGTPQCSLLLIRHSRISPNRDLSSNDIDYLGYSPFSSLTALRSLSFSCSMLDPKRPRTTSNVINSNSISDIPSNAFSDLTSLVYLEQHSNIYCSLTSVSQETSLQTKSSP